MRKFWLTILGIILIPNVVNAAFTNDLELRSDTLKFSDNYLLEGKTVRIYATSINHGNDDLLGSVKFTANGIQIGTDQPISVFKASTDDIFTNWTPLSSGNYQISAVLTPWQSENDDPSNNQITTQITVLSDTDKDGISNIDDIDDDNDNVKDSADAFPLDSKEWEDTDGDRIGDNKDDDDDNDGFLDIGDALPLNPLEWEDTDKDEIGNNSDNDDDNDGISDIKEEKNGTNPVIGDSDGDMVSDGMDSFPLDKTEWEDFDADKIGNNLDNDDDNDKITDTDDYNPKNKGPEIILVDKPAFVPVRSNFTLDASESFDLDGNISTFEWEIDGEGKVLGAKIERAFDKGGEHKVTVTATDDKGESRSMSFIVNVLDYNMYLHILLFIILICLAFILYINYIKARPKNHINQP